MNWNFFLYKFSFLSCLSLLQLKVQGLCRVHKWHDNIVCWYLLDFFMKSYCNSQRREREKKRIMEKERKISAARNKKKLTWNYAVCLSVYLFSTFPTARLKLWNMKSSWEKIVYTQSSKFSQATSWANEDDEKTKLSAVLFMSGSQVENYIELSNYIILFFKTTNLQLLQHKFKQETFSPNERGMREWKTGLVTFFL